MDPVKLDDLPEAVGQSSPMLVGWQYTFRALRHRNYRLFFYGQLVSLTGTWMQQTAMSWMVYQLTSSKWLLGVIAAAGSAPMIFFSIWGGSLADRHSKRAILVGTQTAQMLLAFGLAAVVWAGMATPWLIAVIALLNGITMGFDMPARQAFAMEMTNKEDLLNAISLNSSVFNGARILGPSLAGLLMGSTGVTACFFLNGLSYLAVIIGLLKMKLPPHISTNSGTSVCDHAKDGLLYVIHNFQVRTILILFSVIGVFGWSYAVLMPAFAKDVMGLGAHGYGVMMSASGIGALTGALTIAAVGHLFSIRKLAFGGTCLFAAALLVFAWTRNFYLSLFALTLTGYGMMLFFSTSNTVLQTMVPDPMRGRVMGIWAVIFGLVVPLGSLEAGAIADWVGAPIAIALGAIICALAAAVSEIVVWLHEAKARRSI